ncbi:MAG: SMP-30/gluconolactonase/LRE family protein [Candidatus Gastranaerophilales bacterium]|nr:SMP-30/gluconolactonase/LRE family protein [Candidatus Gastranaerophilales bacterium]
MELIFYNNDKLLEGPVFDNEGKFLYFVSILDNKIYRMNLLTKNILEIKTESNVGCVAPLSNGWILSAEYQGIFMINPEDGTRKFVTHIISDNRVRYNDGKLDSNGRFIVGTKGYIEDVDGIGNLYSLDKNCNSKILVKNTTISNGLAFSKNDKILYFIDTPTKKIGRYSYDLHSGDVKFIDYLYEVSEGYPDGMCCDDNDNLYIAIWGGGKVIQISKQGRLLTEIKLPVLNVSSCNILNNVLYITTAKSELAEQHAGGLYKHDLNKA